MGSECSVLSSQKLDTESCPHPNESSPQNPKPFLQTNFNILDPEVLREVLKKSSIYWETTPFKVTRFRGTCRLLLRGRKIKQSLLHSSFWLLLWLILLIWRWRRNVPPKRRANFKGLRDVIPQKIWLFIFFSHLWLDLSSGLVASGFWNKY